MALWTQESIMKLINTYRSHRILWDTTSPDYTDRNKRIDAWKEVADEVGHDMMTIERKLKSLKTHLLAVHKAYAKKRIRGDCRSNASKPKWFAYEALSFLIQGRPMRTNRETSNSDKQHTSQNTEWKAPQENTSGRDEFAVFAEHVAIRLRNITDRRARLVAQHQINNILFEAEIGKYNLQYDPGMMENLDEPSTSNDDKMMINIT
ncbi:uncharacterized protein [Prorops nasuta]|uniref:uncharacterized protein n=1 Tax=Prorops nasuta TaxID=863751 RepID=UPI0034CF64D0